MTRYDVVALKARLGPIRCEDNAILVQMKSRDFYWYSPVLKRQLEHVTADLIVSPRSEAEVVETLRTCFALGIPVTPRGTGTGNYGQAMPLAGGVVLDLSAMNDVRHVAPGRVVTGPGAILADIDVETRRLTAQELRLHVQLRVLRLSVSHVLRC